MDIREHAKIIVVNIIQIKLFHDYGHVIYIYIYI